MNNIFFPKKPCKLILLVALLFSVLLTTTTSSARTFLQLSESDTIKDILFCTEQSYAYIGTTVVSGDFNGDKIDDVAVSAPGEYGPYGTAKNGFIGIFFGGQSFASLPSKVITGNAPADKGDVKIFGSAAYDSIGWRMTVGDLNNDGKDDLVISAANTSNPQQDSSGDSYEVFIVFGSAKMAAQILLDPADPAVSRLYRDYMHVSALAIGDLDGDGTNDLAISDILTGNLNYPPMRSGRTLQGAVYILKGRATWPASVDLRTSANRTIYRTNTAIDSGTFRAYALATGDLVGGDGKADLILGASKEGAVNHEGKVYIVPGGTGFFTAGSLIDTQGVATSIISSPLAKDYIGGTLAVGNINNDTYPDLLIGSPMSYMVLEENASAVGKVEVMLGKATGLPATVNLLTAGDIILKAKPYTTAGGLGRLQTETGRSVLAEDMNGDGTDDIIIGSPGASFDPRYRDQGVVHIVYGKTKLAAEYILDTDYDMAIAGPSSSLDWLADGKLGFSLAVGDFNANDKPDIIISAPDSVGPFTKTNSGVVAVLYDQAVPSDFNWNLFLPAIIKSAK